jgi:IS30 family transposase
MERTYSQIDMDERRKIARWRTAGISVDVISVDFPMRQLPREIKQARSRHAGSLN